MKPHKEDRQFVDALARGMAILECLSRVQKPLGNGEIARLLTLPPSTVSRLTYTLTELGYLRRSEQGRTYELTPKNLNLGYPLLAGMELRNHLRPYLKEISEQTGHTVALAIRDGLHMCFVDVVQGSDTNATRLATGGRLRMGVSASGVATLAAMNERNRWSTLNRLRSEFQRRGESSEHFEEALETCLRLGYALVRNLWQDGIGGISVPIHWKNTSGALTMPIPTHNVSRYDMSEKLVPVLLEFAEKINAAN